MAAIVDGIVFVPFIFFDGWILNSANNSIIFLWHYKYGQTIGKWVTGVKVVDVSEITNISLKQSIRRDSFYLAFELIGLLYFLFLWFQTGKTEYLLIDYNSFAGVPIFIWMLIELGSMLSNPKRRAIHDFLAKSVVINHRNQQSAKA